MRVTMANLIGSVIIVIIVKMRGNAMVGPLNHAHAVILSGDKIASTKILR